jgi:hypothetical protein
MASNFKKMNWHQVAHSKTCYINIMPKCGIYDYIYDYKTSISVESNLVSFFN